MSVDVAADAAVSSMSEEELRALAAEFLKMKKEMELERKRAQLIRSSIQEIDSWIKELNDLEITSTAEASRLLGFDIPSSFYEEDGVDPVLRKEDIKQRILCHIEQRDASKKAVEEMTALQSALEAAVKAIPLPPHIVEVKGGITLTFRRKAGGVEVEVTPRLTLVDPVPPRQAAQRGRKGHVAYVAEKDGQKWTFERLEDLCHHLGRSKNSFPQLLRDFAPRGWKLYVEPRG